MSDEVKVTQASAHLAQVISAVFDKPIPIESYKEVEGIIARHAAQSRLEGVKMGLEAAAKCCDKEGAYEQEGYGLTRATQNYYRARNYIRALSPADVVKGGE